MKDLLVDYWKTWTEQRVPDELKNLVSLAEKECREFQREKDRGQAFLGNLLFAFDEYGGKYYFVFDLIYHSEFIESNKIGWSWEFLLKQCLMLFETEKKVNSSIEELISEIWFCEEWCLAEKDINLFQDDVPLGAESFVADCCSAYLEGLADFEFSAMNRKDDRYELVVDEMEKSIEIPLFFGVKNQVFAKYIIDEFLPTLGSKVFEAPYEIFVSAQGGHQKKRPFPINISPSSF